MYGKIVDGFFMFYIHLQQFIINILYTKLKLMFINIPKERKKLPI